MRLSAAAVTASSPSSAPLGTMICPPRAFARSIRPGRGSNAPAESTITCFPASNIGRQIRSSIGAGVDSIARSACAGNASGSTKAHAIPSVASQVCALAWSRAAAQASVNPRMPAKTSPGVCSYAARSPTTSRRGPASNGDLTSICAGDNCLERPGRNKMFKSGTSDMLKGIVGACGILLAGTSMALAQAYPTNPLMMIIPYADGGPPDVLGRLMAQRMSEILGQQVVVENVGGAGGMTGSKRVADAAPDGYTFVLGTVGTHAQSQTMYKKPLYHAANDFAPVALIAEVPIVLITRKDLPVNNLQEFIAYAKANQGKMQYGSAGAGSATHLGCVLLNYLIGVDITHVPYRGTGPAMQDLQGGRI